MRCSLLTMCIGMPSVLRHCPAQIRSSGPLGKRSGDDGLNALIPLIRNIGIVAHIDAGKTTTTERMLYYAGVTKRVGDVDSGTTTTDYMQEEMERGITITSAAVSLAWKGHSINLIDTPGHVDFTVEVERALRVVDGVVALFDASAGVQAQSYTVLRQAQKFGTPVIAFMNKMDKTNADFKMALRSVETKLGVEPLLVQIPLLAEDGNFEGVMDIIDGNVLRFDGANGDIISCSSIASAVPHLVDTAADARHTMLAQLSARDDTLSELLIHALDKADGDELRAEASLASNDIKAAIRRHVAAAPAAGSYGSAQYAKRSGRRQLVPVLCGASRRNIGVQPLLDAVLSYLPSPIDRKNLVGFAEDGSEVPLPVPSNHQTCPTIALAFKVIHQPGAKGNLDPLVFFRVYSGKVGPRTRLVNHSHPQRKTETIDKLFVMHANNAVEVPLVSAGNIGAAFLPNTKTGDTLYAAPVIQRLYERGSASARDNPAEVELPIRTLEGIDAPPPAISFSIEAANSRQIPLLEEALTCLEKEDPSLRTSKNEFGQLIISGMGELHLEIIMSRLDREYQVKCKLLRAIIEYREALAHNRAIKSVTLVHNELPILEVDVVWEVDIGPLVLPGVDSQIESSDEGASTDVEDKSVVSPLAKASVVMHNSCREDFVAASQSSGGVTGGTRGGTSEKAVAEVHADMEGILRCFQEAMEECCRSGPIATMPVVGTRLVITRAVKRTPVLTDKLLLPAARSAISTMMRRQLRPDDFRVLEPMMAVEVHLTEATYVGAVVSSLNEKNAVSVDILEDGRSVAAVVPMRNVVRYTMDLRKTAKGNANFFTKLHHYRQVEDKVVLQKILKNLGVNQTA